MIILVRILLGGPGLFLWITGSLVALPMAIRMLTGDPFPLKYAGLFVAALVSAIVGFLMKSTPEILARKARFRFAGKHVPQCLALELAVQLLLFTAVCTMPCVPYVLGQGNGRLCSGLLIAFLSSAWGATRTYHQLAECRGRWEAELAGVENPELP